MRDIKALDRMLKNIADKGLEIQVQSERPLLYDLASEDGINGLSIELYKTFCLARSFQKLIKLASNKAAKIGGTHEQSR